jgi:hypothetical protein
MLAGGETLLFLAGREQHTALLGPFDLGQIYQSNLSSSPWRAAEAMQGPDGMVTHTAGLLNVWYDDPVPIKIGEGVLAEGNHWVFVGSKRAETGSVEMTVYDSLLKSSELYTFTGTVSDISNSNSNNPFTRLSFGCLDSFTASTKKNSHRHQLP